MRPKVAVGQRSTQGSWAFDHKLLHRTSFGYVTPKAEALQKLAIAEDRCANLEARIAELEKPDVRETGNDSIAAEPKGNNDVRPF
jgi:hypothetical protein